MISMMLNKLFKKNVRKSNTIYNSIENQRDK